MLTWLQGAGGIEHLGTRRHCEHDLAGERLGRARSNLHAQPLGHHPAPTLVDVPHHRTRAMRDEHARGLGTVDPTPDDRV